MDTLLSHIAPTLFLCALSGLANAVMDTLAHHFPVSIFKTWRFQQWINPELSWKNKYKLDRNGLPVQPPQARFPGARTWLVWTTDFWHFSQFIMWTSMQLALALQLSVLGMITELHPTIVAVLDVLLYKALTNTVFTIHYQYILKGVLAMNLSNFWDWVYEYPFRIVLTSALAAGAIAVIVLVLTLITGYGSLATEIGGTTGIIAWLLFITTMFSRRNRRNKPSNLK